MPAGAYSVALGENPIAFRNDVGRVWLSPETTAPPPRRSLFFGRNEEEGLRCVYHGWKFDTTGACVDMPSEPAESNFKNKVRRRLSCRREPTALSGSHMASAMSHHRCRSSSPSSCLKTRSTRSSSSASATGCRASKASSIRCVTAAFLHIGAIDPEDTEPGSFDYYITKNRSASFDVVDTEFGTSYGAWRPAEDDSYYWRVAHFLFPFYAMTPTGVLGPDVKVRAYVPVDDENTMLWLLQCHGTEPNPLGHRPARAGSAGGRNGGYLLFA